MDGNIVVYPRLSPVDTATLSFRLCTFAVMNCAAAINSQTTEATNSSGMNENEAQNISVPAYSHQGQSRVS